jgi:hypothetical protein
LEKKSHHHRVALKSCASAHFRIPKQPARGSTDFNKKDADGGLH